MKKGTTKQDDEPSASSLKLLPEIDFSKYRVRRNPYAARIAREGAEVVHDEPSHASLAAIPEADFSTARVRRNTYPTRAAEGSLQYGRGRPRRGEESGPTPVRSLRLPEALWKTLDTEAKARHTTTHALLRELISRFIEQEIAPRRK
jgi:hypothetical protein